MALLRLRQFAEPDHRYRATIELEREGYPRRSAESKFDFLLSMQDQEDTRGYLEDFLQYLHGPCARHRGRIERRMAEIGADLLAPYPDPLPALPSPMCR